MYAILGQPTEAIATVKLAIANGYPPIIIALDPEFASLKSLPEFSRVLQQKQSTPCVENKTLLPPVLPCNHSAGVVPQLEIQKIVPRSK